MAVLRSSGESSTLHGYFETEMFRSHLDDAELDRVVLGSDCANWFKSRLGGTAVTGEPVQEDYGWVLPVTIAGQNFWFMLQKWHTTYHGWHVWIEPRDLLARVLGKRSAAAATLLRDAVDRFLLEDPRITGISWVADPKELEEKAKI